MLFVCLQIAGTVAHLPTHTLNLLAVQYLVSRVLFNILYMRARTELTAYMRSGMWVWSIGLSFYALIRAGNAVVGG